MNLPNRLTLARIVIASLVMFLLFIEGPFVKLSVLVLFLVACLTDFLDGWIARRRGEISDFGRIMDPIADKVLVLGIFLSFVELQLVSAWMVAVIIVREFVITGMRLFAIRRGVVLSAQRFGKHKTVSQMVTIFFILLFLVIKESSTGCWNDVCQQTFMTGIFVLMSLTVILTLFSGFSYVWQNRKLIRSL